MHDVAVVPTSDAFHLRSYWRPLLGHDVGAVRPPEWPVRAGYARASGRRDVVFISVGSSSRLSLAELLSRAEAAVREAAVGAVPKKNRIKPLIAVPVLGIDGGGHGAERGEVVRSLIETLTATAIDIDVDIALVTPDDSVYAAAQHIRREGLPVDGQIRASAESVAQLARSGSWHSSSEPASASPPACRRGTSCCTRWPARRTSSRNLWQDSPRSIRLS